MIGKPLNLPKHPYFSCLGNGFLKIADIVIQHLLCDFSLYQTYNGKEPGMKLFIIVVAALGLGFYYVAFADLKLAI